MIVPVLEQPQKMSCGADNGWHERWGMGYRLKSWPDRGGGRQDETERYGWRGFQREVNHKDRVLVLPTLCPAGTDI